MANFVFLAPSKSTFLENGYQTKIFRFLKRNVKYVKSSYPTPISVSAIESRAEAIL